MIHKDIINNKLVYIEYIKKGKLISKFKSKFIFRTFEDTERTKILNDLDKNNINFYLRFRVIKDANIVLEDENIYTSDSLIELLEIKLVMFENLQEFELCESITNLLDNI